MGVEVEPPMKDTPPMKGTSTRDDTVAELLEIMSTKKEKPGKAAKSVEESEGDSKDATSEAKSSPPSFGRLVQLSRPEWPALSRAVLLSVLCVGVDLLTPEFRKIMDNVIVYPDLKKDDIYGIWFFDIGHDKAYEIRKFVLMTLSCRAISVFFGIMIAITFGLVAERVVVRMRLMLFQSILRQDMGFFDTRTAGELSSRLGPDSMSVQQVATTAIPELLLCVLKATLAAVMMFLQTWELSMMVIALIPVVFAYMLPFMGFMMRLNKDYQDAVATSSDIATQSIGNIRVVRAFGGEAFASALYGRAVGDPSIPGACCWWPRKSKTIYRIGVVKSVLQQLMIQGTITIAITGQQFITWYGYHMIIGGDISYGKFGAFMTYALIIGFQSGKFVKTFYSVFNAMGASQRVFEIIDRQPAIVATGGDTLGKLEGHVTFEDVKFSYPSRPDVQVLTGISFHIPAWSKAAFVGASGSGKSTILVLLERLYDVSAGRVLIDGHDVRQLDAGWLRRRIGVVQQEPVLFGFTIAENIRFGRRASSEAEGTPDVSDEDVVAAASKANAHDFINTFPDGYDTLVGERGIRLSGGQKQRIAIARSILCDPRVMLLDEATSALDSESEHIVQEALDRLMKNRTVLIVAHRLSTVVNADQIIVMTKNGIMDSGSHDQLLGRCETYKELVKRQMVDTVEGTLDVSEVSQTEAQPGTALPTVEPEVSPKSGKSAVQHPNARASHSLDEQMLEKILMMDATAASKKKNKAGTDKSNPDEQEMKPKPKTKPTAGFFMKLVRPEFPIMVGMLFFTLISTVIEVHLPMWQGDVVDVVISGRSDDDKQSETRRVMITILLLSLATQVIHYIRVVVSSMAGERIVARLRLWIFNAISSQEMDFFDTQTSGALTSRLTSDTTIVQAAATSAFMEFFLGIAKAAAATILAFRVSWELALMTLATGPVTGMLILPFLGWLMKVHVKYGDALALSAGIATEATGSMKTVLSFGSEDFMERLYSTSTGRLDGPGVVCWWPRKSHSTYRYGAQKSVAIGVLIQVSMFVGLSCMTLIVWYSYDSILKGNLTLGDVFTFVMYGMQIAQGLAGAMGGMGGCVAAKAALQRVFEIYSRTPAIANSDGERPDDFLKSRDVRFEDVSFAYPSRPGVQVLDCLNFVVPANSTAAFVGSSGAGKSSVLALLQRFYEADSGRVLIGGDDIKNFDASWLRRRIGIVQQEPVLFGFDIRQNIAYGHNAARIVEGGEAATDMEIQRVAEMANVHSFVSELPDRYQTLVGERGILLSGGQKQRVAVARALLTEPPILLLDEATSALDAESEHLVQEAIQKAMANRTVLLVAHRLSTVREADQIHVMAAGKLVDSGKHQELYSRCERYQELVKHQIRMSSVSSGMSESTKLSSSGGENLSFSFTF